MRRAILTAAIAAVASAGTWSVIDSDIATIDVGVAFTSDTVGYAGTASNGAGPQVLKTTNGGVNWTPCPATFGLDVLLLDTDATENTIVVSSVFGELYSDDAGKSFQPSTGGGTSQSVRYIGTNGDGGLKFGVTGQYYNVEGVGISVDGGKTFKTYNANLQTEARYGAFPSDDVWYIAAGNWPGGADDDGGQVDGKYRFDGRSYARSKPRAPRAPNASPAPTAGYFAQISKTSDGGATFKTVFNVSNQFYFNAIDCQPSNPNVCCAVGEADSDSPVPGSRIHCTTNGGATWTRNFYAPGNATNGYSLMEIRYATDNEVWAVGGASNSATYTMEAWFLSSTDGGTTWSHGVPPMANYYAVSLSFPDATHGFASMLDVATQASAIAVYK